MHTQFARRVVAALVVLVELGAVARAADPLPSWSDGKAKRAITEFVGKVTKVARTEYSSLRAAASAAGS